MDERLLLLVLLASVGVFLYTRQASASVPQFVSYYNPETGQIEYTEIPHSSGIWESEEELTYDPTVSNWQLPPEGEPYRAAIQAAETAYGIPPMMLARLLWQESRFNPNAYNASSGASGIAQFLPSTAAEWGVDVWNAASSIDGAGRYLAWLYGRTGDWALALAAYNWGIGNVERQGMSRAPNETQNYVASILGDLGYA